MTTVISIYGKPFSIGFSEGDAERRSAYFKSGTGILTPQEKSLLLSLGVDAILENSLKPYLPEFFSSLQTCSSDASLVLSKSCETAYFVIWSALFHNRAEIARRMKEQKGEVISDIDLAQDAAIISGLKGRPLEKKRISGTSEDDDMRRLFTLMVMGEAGSIPVNSEDEIDRLFTLMVLGNEESSNAGAS